MKKTLFRRLSVILVMVMLISVTTGLPGITAAAGEPPAFTLVHNKLYVTIGDSMTLKIKNVTSKDIREVKVNLTDKRIADARVDKTKKKIIVTGKKVGTAMLTAILVLNRPINNKKQFRLKCKVNVLKPYIPEPTPTLEPFVLEPDDTITPNVGIIQSDSFTFVSVENGIQKRKSAHFSIVHEEKNNGKMYVTIKNDGQLTGTIHDCICHLIQGDGESTIRDVGSDNNRIVSPGSEYILVFDVMGFSFTSYRLELNGELSGLRDVATGITAEIKNVSPTNDNDGKVIEMMICNQNNFFVRMGVQILVKKNGRIVDVIDGNQGDYFNRLRDSGKGGLISGLSRVKPNKNNQAYITYYPTKDFGDGLEFVLVSNSSYVGKSGVDDDGKDIQGREERVKTSQKSDDISYSSEWSMNLKDHIVYGKCTNSGNDGVYVYADIFFYKGDRLVDYCDIEIGHEDYGISPGMSLYGYGLSWEDFDNFYVNETVEKTKTIDLGGTFGTSSKTVKNKIDGYKVTITRGDSRIKKVSFQIALKNSQGEVVAKGSGSVSDFSSDNMATCFIEHNNCYSFDSEGNYLPDPFDLFGEDLPNYYLPDYSEVASQEILIFGVKRSK